MMVAGSQQITVVDERLVKGWIHSEGRQFLRWDVLGRQVSVRKVLRKDTLALNCSGQDAGGSGSGAGFGAC